MVSGPQSFWCQEHGELIFPPGREGLLAAANTLFSAAGKQPYMLLISCFSVFQIRLVVAHDYSVRCVVGLERSLTSASVAPSTPLLVIPHCKHTHKYASNWVHIPRTNYFYTFEEILSDIMHPLTLS